MPPNLQWGLVIFNVIYLSVLGVYWWAHSGERTMIFYGRNNYETDLISARWQGGLLGVFSILVVANLDMFGMIEINGPLWIWGPHLVLGVSYYIWRRAVAVKREKERLARNLKPIDHA